LESDTAFKLETGTLDSIKHTRRFQKLIAARQQGLADDKAREFYFFNKLDTVAGLNQFRRGHRPGRTASDNKYITLSHWIPS
jgi:hypothetical protein